MNKYIFIIFILLISSRSYADINIYLFPKIEKKSENIILKDIAKIEAAPEIINDVIHIEINSSIYSDGFIDRKELLELLKSRVNESIHIFGNAVRIIAVEKEEIVEPEVFIKSGSILKLVVVKNGIRIEMQGIAMTDGKVGDLIPVKLKKSKIVKGKIINERLVELEL